MARILVVVDEHLVAHDLAQIVSLLGHEVSGIAATGEDAVKKAGETNPELMLMDVRLKGDMDGIEAARRIRSRRDVPVVFLTAFGDPATIAGARDVEASGYLLKPYSERELHGAIEVALHKHRLTQALKDREKWFFTTLSSIREAVLATDAEGRVSFLNPAAEALTGESRVTSLGRPVEEVVHLSAEALPLGRRKLLRPDGGERLVEISISRIPGDDGHDLGQVHVLRDVTERRALETQLSVTERLASLGTLTAGIAHEINNPLAFDLANQTYALDELPRLRERLGRLGDSAPYTDITGRLALVEQALSEGKDGAERVRGIVRDLKTFSRGDEQRRAVDLSRVVEIAVNLAGAEVRRRARLVCETLCAPKVYGNEQQLAQLVTNLLVNAAQAIHPGDAERNEVRLTLRADGSQDAVLEIQDTGHGIAPEIRDRIFDPFFTTRPAGGGTGLGLSIVHGIVRAHEGEISVEGRPTGGTLFRVRLPAFRDEPARAMDAADGNDLASPARRARVLVVDDSPVIGAAVARLLGRRHDVKALGDAESALALFQTDRAFDLVLCDLALGSASGLDLLLEVTKRWPAFAERFVFITGGAFLPRDLAFVDAHPERVVQKPFDPAVLEALVGRALDHEARPA